MVEKNNSVANILIIAPAWIGDMVMMQPLTATLKAQNPSTKITVLAPKSTLALAGRMATVDELIEQPLGHGELNLALRYKLGKTLRNKHYTQALVLPHSFKSALIPWWAKIKKRIGYVGEQRWLLLNNIRRLDKATATQVLSHYLALAFPSDYILPTALPCPTLVTSNENQQTCLNGLKLNITERRVLALCPGAAYGPARRWPAKHFAQVAQYYLDQDWQVWLFAAASEKNITAKINTLTAQRCVDLAGKTTLVDAIDLLALAKIVISNDTGLMHIAAAVDLPVVAIYGSSSPHYTQSLKHQYKILQLTYDCIPCFKRECYLTHDKQLRCLKNLTASMVINASESLY